MARKADDPEPTIDRVSVINRRLENPFGAPSREIPLRGEKRNWVVRTFVADKEHQNRHYDAVHVYGYVPLTVKDWQSTRSPLATQSHQRATSCAGCTGKNCSAPSHGRNGKPSSKRSLGGIRSR